MLVEKFRELIKKYGLYTYRIDLHYCDDMQREYGSDTEVPSEYDTGIKVQCEHHTALFKFMVEDDVYVLSGISCDQDNPEYEIIHLEQAAQEKMAIHGISCELADTPVKV